VTRVAGGERDGARVVTSAVLRSLPLPAYGAAASKAARGKLLLVAGSQRLPGPALLAARAALRIGCGTVRAAIPASIATAVGVALPELMVLPLAGTDAGTLGLAALSALESQYPAVQAGVLGPGLDEHGETTILAARLIADAPFPLVVDAAGLAAYADAPPAGGAPTAPRVLTPHDGEMHRLTGSAVPPEGADEPGRERLAVAFARDRGVTLVLKGRQTLVAGPEGDLYRNTAGTRGLGVAGSGDTLAGILGGLLAQDMHPTAAAVWAVHLHALAGVAAAAALGPDGLLASDIVERLPSILRTARHRAAGARPRRRG
jgi:ADP-dependent NAD(P)H-hydrate dehydratase